MSKLSPKVLRLIAVAVSLLVAGLIYSYLSDLKAEEKKEQGVVVLAAMDISKNALITADMVKTVPMAKEAIQMDSYVNAGEVVGVMAKEAIYAGEQVNKRRLLEDQKMAGFVGLIPDDKRAVSIGISDVTAVAGFVKPGNFVDVMLISGKDTINGKILLQDMMLLAVNKSENTESKDGNKEQMATATLAASPEEAVRLAVAQQQGTLYLALRPVHPKNRLSLASEINVYVATPANRSAAQPVAPSRPSVKLRDYTPPSQPAVPQAPAGESISVIRGNTVQSVTTR